MIKEITSPKLIFLLAMLLLSPIFVLAQEEPRPEDPRSQFANPNQERPNLLRALGLSREQVQQIRRIKAEHQPLRQAARQKIGETMRNLDQAIYSDSMNEKEVEQRLKEFQMAQAELARINFQDELAVRKLLTPDQLVTFRELRRRFGQARENMEKRRQNPDERLPLRRLKQQSQQLRND